MCVHERDGGLILKMYMAISPVSATECVWAYGVCKYLLSVL